jgi:hypothetical protein
MVGKVKGYKELTLISKKTMFGILWMSCKHGKIEHGKKMSVAGSFEVTSRTVSIVWDDACSVMEAHLIAEMDLEGLHLFCWKELVQGAGVLAS